MKQSMNNTAIDFGKQKEIVYTPYEDSGAFPGMDRTEVGDPIEREQRRQVFKTEIEREAHKLWLQNKEKRIVWRNATKRFQRYVTDWGIKKNKQRQRWLQDDQVYRGDKRNTVTTHKVDPHSCELYADSKTFDRSKSRDICLTEEQFLESDSELISDEEEEEESSSSEDEYDEEEKVKRIQEMMTDVSLFPEGKPIEFKEQFIEACISDEEQSFFKISEEMAEKIKKKFKSLKKKGKGKKKKKKGKKKKGKKGKKKKTVAIAPVQFPKGGSSFQQKIDNIRRLRGDMIQANSTQDADDMEDLFTNNGISSKRVTLSLYNQPKSLLASQPNQASLFCQYNNKSTSLVNPNFRRSVPKIGGRPGEPKAFDTLKTETEEWRKSQLNEISVIKQDLARDDVPLPVKTLERAILLPKKESLAVENPRESNSTYPEISTLLFKNPFEVKKKKKGKKKGKKGKKKKK